MKDQMKTAAENPAAPVNATNGTNQRRPFTKPTVQKVGELKELTQQFGGSL